MVPGTGGLFMNRNAGTLLLVCTMFAVSGIALRHAINERGGEIAVSVSDIIDGETLRTLEASASGIIEAEPEKADSPESEMPVMNEDAADSVSSAEDRENFVSILPPVIRPPEN